MKFVERYTFALAALAVFSHSQAGALNANWVMECVGRSEVSLPDHAEAAIYPLSVIQQLSVPPGEDLAAKFPDGQIAGYTRWNYRGAVYVSTAATQEQAKDVLLRYSHLKKEAHLYVAHHKLDDLKIPQTFDDFSVAGHSEAWMRGTSFNATWLSSDSVVHWSSTIGAGTADGNASAFHAISSSRKRLPFDHPAGQGVCLPSLFIPDDGGTDRVVATTYRLKEHPDLTIWIEDRDGTASDNQLDHLRQSAKDSEFFWTQNYQDANSVRSLWKTPHPVEGLGISGSASFVELGRTDGTLDYGYFASFWGTPESALGSTQIKMFVIRDAKVAKAKGIVPIEREALLDMAEAVMHSIKARTASGP